jgi:hypothetical protein
MGAAESQRPRDEDIIVAELDEDFEPAAEARADAAAIKADYGEVTEPRPEQEGDSAGGRRDSPADRAGDVAAHPAEKGTGTVTATRAYEDLTGLPEDVAGAFDQMKVAILRHKAQGWREISRKEMLGVLDALKELARAPSVDGPPF